MQEDSKSDIENAPGPTLLAQQTDQILSYAIEAD